MSGMEMPVRLDDRIEAMRVELAAFQTVIDELVAAERRASDERFRKAQDRIGTFFDMPGPLPGKRELRELLSRILDEEAAR